MDERLLTIVKAVALGPTDSDDCDTYCAFPGCSALAREFPDIHYLAGMRHDRHCPVTLARAIMKEQGSPVNVYQVNFERCNNLKRKILEWIPIESHTIAFSPEDAAKEFTWENSRNVQAMFIRELE